MQNYMTIGEFYKQLGHILNNKDINKDEVIIGTGIYVGNEQTNDGQPCFPEGSIYFYTQNCIDRIKLENYSETNPILLGTLTSFNDGTYPVHQLTIMPEHIGKRPQ